MVVGGFGALAELPIVVRLVVLAVVRYFGLVHFALGGGHGRLSAGSLETFTAFQIDNVLDNAESLFVFLRKSRDPAEHFRNACCLYYLNDNVQVVLVRDVLDKTLL